MANVTDGSADCWAVRWIMGRRTDCYTVMLSVRGGFGAHFYAVVDDYGSLVRIW